MTAIKEEKEHLVRRLAGAEVMNGYGGICGNACTVQAVWLNAKRPLGEQLVRKVLLMMCRKFALLRLCIERRGFSLWFKYMKTTKIDFEVTSDNVNIVYHNALNSKFNMYEGPLWKARLIAANQNNYVFLFAIQHVITDAFTNITLCREFVNMVNDCLNGHELGIYEYPVSPSVIDIVDGECSFMLSVQYFLDRLWRCGFRDFSQVTSFCGALPVPKNYKNAYSDTVYDELTKVATKKLITKCKANQITVNSCLVAAMDLTLFQTAKQFGFIKDSAAIYAANCVNTRRYYPNEYRHVLGSHYSVEEHVIVADINDYLDFWSFAQKVHEKICHNLNKENLPLKLAKILKYASIPFVLNKIFKNTFLNTKTDCHFVCTNMGDVTSLLETKQGPVQIVSLRRSVQSEYSQQVLLFAAQTFKDQLLLSLDYYTNKINKETVKVIFNNLLNNLRYLADNDILYVNK